MTDINTAGQLMDYMIASANDGVQLDTEIFVRVGTIGPVYKIDKLMGQRDQRGLRLILQTSVLPTTDI